MENAPIFCPSLEEFNDTLAYIQKISTLASSYGICKIRPPSTWKPPFAINESKFTFCPRIQNLVEVGADNRVKNDFITSLVNFWELKNTKIFAPYIKGKYLDLFKLWRVVKSFGGHDKVCSGKQWSEVCKRLDMECSAAIASAISDKYKKIILPFEIFFTKSSNDMPNPLQQPRRPPRTTKLNSKSEPFCHKCGKSDRGDVLLVCDGCDFSGAYHTYCLEPPLSGIPKDKWFCPGCFAKQFQMVNRLDEFGFRRSPKTYTLRSFGIHADEFKAKYFGRPIHITKLSDVEIEFWRLISDSECELSVEYGADLCVSDVGSGFPRKNLSSGSYANSAWNLNNFATNELSALRFLPADISGMKVPWCYVGMVFSCFCWHTEDHWSFSINYLHRGEPKTWYGVPGSAANAFESAMRTEVPELFERSPDLLHHMTTLLPPERLLAHGVPVYKVDQFAGEFVITFPRAYHGGFNHGFNFAEAVNFCPATWFPFGWNCIEEYALVHRPPVFSHAELLCRMAESLDSLSIDFLRSVTDQLADLLVKERSLRRHLAHLGVRRTERFIFEICEEELRECCLCKTTLFTSAITCDCSKNMVCLEHYPARSCCPVEDQVMLYRYGLDELSEFIEKPQARLSEYASWQRLLGELTASPMLPCAKQEAPDEVKSTLWTSHTDAETKPPPCDAELSVSTEQETCATAVSGLTKSPVFGDFSNKPESSEGNITTPNEPHKGKLTLTEIKELVSIGKKNRYPLEGVLRLQSLVENVEECAAVIRSLVMDLPADEDVVGASSDQGVADDEGDDEEDDNEARHAASAFVVTYPRTEVKHAESAKIPAESCLVPSTPQKFRGRPAITGDSSNTRSRRSKAKEKENNAEAKNLKKQHLTGPLASKLSLQEFASFVRVVLALPCVISETQLLNRFTRQLADWRAEARALLRTVNQRYSSTIDGGPEIGHVLSPPPHVPSVAKISKMIQIAKHVKVDLPELKRLDRVLECAAWLEDVGHILDPMSTPSKPRIDTLCSLQLRGDAVAAAVAYTRTTLTSSTACLQTGEADFANEGITMLAMAPSPAESTRSCGSKSPFETVLDIALSRASVCLLEVIGQAQQLEEEANSIINSSSRELSLEDSEALLLRMKGIHASFSASNHLENQCQSARRILMHFKAFSRLLECSPHVSPVKTSEFPAEFAKKLKLDTTASTPRVWLDYFEELCSAAENLPFKFPSTHKEKLLLKSLDRIHSKIEKIFIKPNSTHVSSNCLLELLLPRPYTSLEILIRRDVKTFSRNSYNEDTDSHDVSETRRRGSADLERFDTTTYLSACADNAKSFLASLENGTDFDLLYDSVYSRMIEEELKLVLALRKSNTDKSKHQDQDKMTYCVCRQLGFSGFMLQCELCRDWFHGKCVGFPSKDIDVSRVCYTCLRCERSLRPDLAQIVSILEDLIPLVSGDVGYPSMNDLKQQTLSCTDIPTASSILTGLVPHLISVPFLLRLPNLTAVEMLCERAFAFVRRVHKVIMACPELAQMLAEYEVFAGMQMPWNSFNDSVSKNLPHKGRDPIGLSPHDLPPNVRPPGMQPLMLRTTAPRTTHYSGRGRPIGSVNGGRGALRGAPRGRPPNIPVPIAQGSPGGNTGFAPLRPVLSKRPRHSVDLDEFDNEASSLTHSVSPSRFIENLPKRSPSVCGKIIDASQTNTPAFYAAAEAKEAEAAFALAGLSTGMVHENRSVIPRPSITNPSSMSPHSISDQFKAPVRPTLPHTFPSPRPKDYRRLSSELQNEAHGPTSSRFFRFRLSKEARSRLDQLIVEACSLEVRIPHTRWLWQLSLAADPDSRGAADPRNALLNEITQKQKLIQYQQTHYRGGRCFGEAHKRQRRRSEEGSGELNHEKIRVEDTRTRSGEQLVCRVSSSIAAVRSSTTGTGSQGRGLYRRQSLRKPRETYKHAAYKAKLARVGGDMGVRHRPYWHKRALSSLKRGAQKRIKLLQSTMVHARHLNKPRSDEGSDAFEVGSLLIKRRALGEGEVQSAANRCVSQASTGQRTDRRLARNAFIQQGDDEQSLEDGEDGASDEEDGEGNETAHQLHAVQHEKPESVASLSSNIRRGRRPRVISESGTSDGDERKRLSGEHPSFQAHVFPGTSMCSAKNLSRQPRGRRSGLEVIRRGAPGRRATSRHRRGSNRHAGPGRPPANRTSSTEGSEEEEFEEELCEVPGGCRKPRGTVEWIACDRCNAWYHQVCVSIMSVREVPEIFVCSNCHSDPCSPKGDHGVDQHVADVNTTEIEATGVQFRPLPTSRNAKFAAFGGSQFELHVPGNPRKRRHFSVKTASAQNRVADTAHQHPRPHSFERPVGGLTFNMPVEDECTDYSDHKPSHVLTAAASRITVPSHSVQEGDQRRYKIQDQMLPLSLLESASDNLSSKSCETHSDSQMLGGVSPSSFLSGANTGAAALLQAIEVLDSRPTATEQYEGNTSCEGTTEQAPPPSGFSSMTSAAVISMNFPTTSEPLSHESSDA